MALSLMPGRSPSKASALRPAIAARGPAFACAARPIEVTRMNLTIRVALLTLLASVTARAQQASYTYFGGSCLTVDLTAQSLPRLGQPLVLQVPSGFRLSDA